VRYLILEDIGCINSIYQSWVEVVINPIPVFLFDVISLIYSILTFCAFRRIRAQGRSFSSIHSDLTNSRYIRLMSLAAMVAICSIAFQSCILSVNLTRGISPWISFKKFHASISSVPKFSAHQWRSAPDGASTELGRWLWVICALFFFAFFGFSDEAVKHYRYATSLAGSYVGVSSQIFGSHSSSSRYVISSIILIICLP